MRPLKHFLLYILVCNLVISCQKPIEAGPNSSSSGNLSKDGNGNCLPVNINGIYKINIPLGATHYMDVSVNISSPGAYQIATDMVNGIHFGDSAQFTATGVQTVRLKGYGMPLNTGVFSFTVHYGNSSCAVAITVSPAGSPPASFTLTGAPGACTSPLIQGSYTAGTILNTFNTLIVAVNVTGIGDYTLSTTVVNGISFSATGTFTAMGNQTVSLSGSGTPLNAGTNPMSVSGPASSCSFPLTVVGPPPPDPVASVFIATREWNAANTASTVSLTCYNPNNTVRWKRTELGNTATEGNAAPSNSPSIEYANGIAYYCLDSMFSTGPNSYFRYNFFYAIDVNTGNDIWKRRSTVDNIQNPIVRNGIIYCNLHTSTGNNIAALSAADGTLIWSSPIPEYYGAEYLELEGNMLYYMTSSSSATSQVNAFNINTKTVVWQKSIGINFNAVYSRMVSTGGLIIIKNGTNSLLAINKSDGATVWTKPGFGVPVFANNFIYAVDNNKVFYAFMPSDGSIKYQWPSGLSIGTTPYVLDDNFYFTGWDPVLFSPFVASYKALTATPVLNWTRPTGQYQPEFIVAAGNTVYGTKRGAIINGLTTYTIVMYDRNTGAAQDSIVTSGFDISVTGLLRSSGTYVEPNF